MKLLRAFIEASGFDITDVPTPESIIERDEYIKLGCAFDPKLEYDYKVTKKLTETISATKIGIDPRIIERQNNRDVIVEKLKGIIFMALKKAGKEPKKDTRIIINHHINEAIRNL